MGLIGLRILEATSADISDLGEEDGRRVLRVCGKGTKIVRVPMRALQLDAWPRGGKTLG